MTKNNTLTHSSTTNDAGSNSQPAAVTPEQVVEQLRALRATLTDLSTLAEADKIRLSRRKKLSGDVLQAQINMMGVSDEIPVVIGTPADNVQNLADALSSWSDVEDELRIVLNAVESHNLVTRQALQSLTSRAMNIGVQLARDPKKASVYGTHLNEIRRLKRLGRRKNVAKPTTPQSPAPEVK